MAMHRLGEIADALISGGLAADTPAAVIASATLAEERIVISTLGRIAAEVAGAQIDPPAIVVVGDIVSARERLLGFELSASPAGRWRLRTLYAFKGQPDAGFPYGGLVRDAAGNLYGTSYYEGAGDLGAVYQLSPKSGGGWKERVLYSFRGGLDGSNSIATLVFGAGGVLYGTTSEGGAPGCSCGTIFAMTPGPGGRWRESVVYRFEGVPDGAFAYNGMVADPAGNLYGTTVHGGADNEGSIYQFTP